MVYKRVRGWTSGRSLPVLNFVKSPPPGMVYRRNIPAEKRAHGRYLRDKEHMKLKEIAQVCDIATSSVHRIGL